MNDTRTSAGRTAKSFTDELMETRFVMVKFMYDYGLHDAGTIAVIDFMINIIYSLSRMDKKLLAMVFIFAALCTFYCYYMMNDLLEYVVLY